MCWFLNRILKTQIWTFAECFIILLLFWLFFSSFCFRFLIMRPRTRGKTFIVQKNKWKSIHTARKWNKTLQYIGMFFLSHWQQCRCNAKQSKQNMIINYTFIIIIVDNQMETIKSRLKEEIEIYDRRFCSKLNSLSTQPSTNVSQSWKQRSCGLSRIKWNCDPSFNDHLNISIVNAMSIFTIYQSNDFVHYAHVPAHFYPFLSPTFKDIVLNWLLLSNALEI